MGAIGSDPTLLERIHVHRLGANSEGQPDQRHHWANPAQSAYGVSACRLTTTSFLKHAATF